jgi:hypothetical protein
MAIEQESAYERLLSANLGRAIDWVKYGDAKNAALLAFVSAWIAGIGNLLLAAEEKKTAALVVLLLFVCELLFLIGAVYAISALLPRTDPKNFLRRLGGATQKRIAGPPVEDPKPNLLFFGHIRTLEPDAFRAAISRRYRPRRGQVTTEDYLTDMSAQTVVNSRIAQRKFDLFNRGVLFVYFALCFLMLPLTIALLRASVR